MAGIHQPVEYATQHPHVVEMEARRRLVEDVQLPLPTAAPAAAGESELARNLGTLRFTPGQRRRRLAELEITETYLLEVPESAREARMAMQSLDGLVDGPVERLGDAEPLQLDVEHFAFEPRSAANIARDEDVGEKHHFDQHVPGALARLAPSTGDVERERTGRITSCPRQRFIGEQRPQLVKRFHIRDRVRAWRAPDRFLIDADDVLQRLPPFQVLHDANRLARELLGSVFAAQSRFELAEQHIVHQRRFPGSRYAGDGGERAGWNACGHPGEGVEARP